MMFPSETCLLAFDEGWELESEQLTLPTSQYCYNVFPSREWLILIEYLADPN